MKNKLLLTFVLLFSWVAAQAHSGGVWIANDGCGHWYAIIFHYHNGGSSGATSGTGKAGLYIDYDQDGVFNVNGAQYAYTDAAGFTTSNGDFQRFTDWIDLTDQYMSADNFANNATAQNEVLNWLNSNKNFGKQYSLSVAITGTYSSTWREALIAPIKPLSPGIYKTSTSTSSMVETPIGYSNPFELNYTPTNFTGFLSTQSTCGETLQIDANLTQTCVEEYGIVYSLTNELPSVNDADVNKQTLWSGNATDFSNENLDYTVSVDPGKEFQDHYVRTYYLQNVAGTYFYVYSPLVTAMPLDPNLDCDGDGITNGEELDTSDPNKDTDGDGTPDYKDNDSNNDGVTDAEDTGTPDCDEDGVKDFHDMNNAPVIQAQPSNTTICDMNDASFSTSVTGGGLSYQWQVNEGTGFVDVINDNTYSNATTNTLNISAAPVGMDGFIYRCVINSSSCNTSSTTYQASLSINFVSAPNTTDVTYNLEESASALSTHITGQNLTYYDAATGGTAVVHEITPQTNNIGVTEYWVSQTIDGCESDRAKLTVTVVFPYELSGSSDPKSTLYSMNNKVDASITVSGSGDITDPKVYISSAYQNGDKLIAGMDLPTGLSANFDTNNGSLNFSGTASPAVWQEIFRNVMFSSTSSNTQDRTISFILANGMSLKVNGQDHYYQYISGSKTWAQAKTAAEGMTFLGLQGYLVSVTSQEENDFIENKLGSDGWIGATDDYNYINAALGTSMFADQASAEGKWYWVSGPEKGQAISIGNNSPVAVDGHYMNWNLGEPNNSSGEHYMQLYATQNGKWNDLNSSTTLNGFVVEYGGYEGEVAPSIQQSRVISFDQGADLSLTVNEIDENRPAGTIIDSLILGGIDDDAAITFSLVSGNGDTDNAFFTVEDGKLVTTASLDYEANSNLSIRVQAQDAYGSAYEQELSFTINNLNDNAPVIAANQSFDIDENSAENTVIGTVAVSDADGTTTYEQWTITAGNNNEAFQIDATTGMLSVANALLDYETVATYTLTVSVKDGANTSDEVDVTIDVNNLNDNAPVIAANQSFDIDENSTQNTVVGTVAVSDADGSTAYEQWTITAGNTNTAFQIDATTGELSVANALLDYETVATYTLTVSVQDGANTSAEVDLTIDVNNLNDNAPVIAANQSFDIDENSAQNTVVGTVAVSDVDGNAAYEQWTIIAGNNNEAFQIDATTGELSVANALLDYETVATYTLTVSVQDGANTSAEVDVIINVNNLNDNSPVITSNQSFDIDENSAQNTTVGTVLVSDADGSTAYEHWTITAGNSNETFQIDATTGELTVKNALLDYETVATYTLTVSVQDGANTSAEVDLTIDVNNLNDNAPVIAAAQSFYIDENSANASPVGSVTATDADGTTEFNWFLNNEENENAFSIDQATGLISVLNASLLDAERKTLFVMEVIASDGKHQYREEVNIHLNNVNDNIPQIAENQQFIIEENSSNDLILGQLVGSDSDANDVLGNWTIVSGNTANTFSIDPTTGVLSVHDNAALDFETIRTFSLGITTDDGAFTSEIASVEILLTDLNDVTPVITEHLTFVVTENAINSTEVGQMKATDPDSNTTFTEWKIVKGNDQDAFSIDAHSGMITVNNSEALDFERTAAFELKITVSDGLHMSRKEKVSITLENRNDNTPTEVTLSNNLISEKEEAGSLVGYFNTFDQDAVDDFTYQLVDGEGSDDNSFFEIEADQLILKTAVNFDYHKALTIRVQSKDIGGIAIEANLTIQVRANMETEISIPTAFTPNGDGFNDTWEIDRLTNYPQSVVRIYNSDGIEVFKNTGYTKKWDGLYRGKLMAIGNYYYAIQLNDAENKVYRGSVMIIK